MTAAYSGDDATEKKDKKLFMYSFFRVLLFFSIYKDFFTFYKN